MSGKMNSRGHLSTNSRDSKRSDRSDRSSRAAEREKQIDSMLESPIKSPKPTSRLLATSLKKNITPATESILQSPTATSPFVKRKVSFPEDCVVHLGEKLSTAEKDAELNEQSGETQMMASGSFNGNLSELDSSELSLSKKKKRKSKKDPHKKRNNWLIAAAMLLVLALMAIIAIIPIVRFQESSEPVCSSDISFLLPPGARDTECTTVCKGLSGTPVTANGLELKKVILEYIHDPMSSPHGPVIGCWDVSQVTNMVGAFSHFAPSHPYYDPSLDLDPCAGKINEPLTCWDTSSVTDMSWTFYSAYAFNQDIGAWNVSAVSSMLLMFSHAQAFNQDIGLWDVSNVDDMGAMFQKGYSFNKDISQWDVSSVTEMSAMFMNAIAFDQDISLWDVSSVGRKLWPYGMEYMFRGARSFDQNLCKWVEKLRFPRESQGDMFLDTSCALGMDPYRDWCHSCEIV